MRKELAEQLHTFHIYNDIVLKNEIVIFGSTYTSNFPFYELSQKYLFSHAIYNRSVKGLTLEEADNCLSDCVLDISPEKLFLALGEEDLDNPQAISMYEHILRRVQDKSPSTDLYVLSVCAPKQAADAFNAALKSLCARLHVPFLDLCYSVSDEPLSYGRIFRQLARLFRSAPLTFGEALEACH